MKDKNDIIADEQGGPDVPALEVDRVRKVFGDRAILDDFSLIVRKDENVAVLGKSGAGKSVLIKCIIGLLTPDRGEIKVLGENVVGLKQIELDRIRTKIGFLFQGNAIFDSMSIRENLEFPLRRHWFDVSQQEIDSMVAEALENVNLMHTIDMMPSELSGGMLKRVALARTMILKPDIILYDEPTTGLDPVTARGIDALIVSLHRKYRTAAIIISHYMNCVKNTSDRVVLLLDGKCYAAGTYEEFENSSDEKIRQFFE